MPGKLLSRREVARRLLQSLRTTESMFAKGWGPAQMQVGGRLYVLDSDLEDWLAQQRLAPGEARRPLQSASRAAIIQDQGAAGDEYDVVHELDSQAPRQTAEAA